MSTCSDGVASRLANAEQGACSGRYGLTMSWIQYTAASQYQYLEVDSGRYWKPVKGAKEWSSVSHLILKCNLWLCILKVPYHTVFHQYIIGLRFIQNMSLK